MLPFGLVFETADDGRLKVLRSQVLRQGEASGGSACAPALPRSAVALRFVDNGDLMEDPAGVAGSSAVDAEAMIQRACCFDLYPAALLAIEELLALQLEVGVKHLQRIQEEGQGQSQRMLPILAAQKAAKRQLHQALSLVHSDEEAATRFAVGIKSISGNYSEELQLCIRILSGVETFLLQAGAWLSAQAVDQPLEPPTVAALVTFSAVGSQANAARGLLQDALQYWE